MAPMPYTYKGCQLVSTIPRKQNISNSITEQKMGMPQIAGVADGGNSFNLGRNIYINGYEKNIAKKANLKLINTKCESNIRRREQSCGKPIVIYSSGQRIQELKNNAIGRGSTNVKNNSLPIPMSFNSSDNSNKNLIKSTISRCRSGGCVAPAKKKYSNSTNAYGC